MKVLEENGSMHIILHMDAIYIYIYINKVYKSTNVEPIDVKHEKKHGDSSVTSVFSNYAYHDLNKHNRYENHPSLKDHYKLQSCVLTCIFETYYEQFQNKKSDGIPDASNK